eukprot:162522_1
MIIFRWVTRGTHPQLIRSNLTVNWKVLQHYKNIRIEILTETCIGIDPTKYGIPSHYFAEIVTPKEFETPNKTLFKARGLHYGALNSPFAQVNNCYVFHCDEESIVTHSLLRGCKKFVTNYYGKIGQGLIVYKNEESTLGSYICHMADSSRSGHDISTFLFQELMLKRALVGFHGSFVLTPHEIEVNEETSFDNCGEYGSIAEDAWWCFLEGNNDKIEHCQGVLIEDSPFTIGEIIKQRNRWFTGLCLLVR